VACSGNLGETGVTGPVPTRGEGGLSGVVVSTTLGGGGETRGASFTAVSSGSVGIRIEEFPERRLRRGAGGPVLLVEFLRLEFLEVDLGINGTTGGCFSCRIGFRRIATGVAGSEAETCMPLGSRWWSLTDSASSSRPFSDGGDDGWLRRWMPVSSRTRSVSTSFCTRRLRTSSALLAFLICIEIRFFNFCLYAC